MATWKFTVKSEGGVDRITIPEYGPATETVASHILDPSQKVVAVFLEPQARAAKAAEWDPERERRWQKGVEWVTREHVESQGCFLVHDPGRPTAAKKEVMA